MDNKGIMETKTQFDLNNMNALLQYEGKEIKASLRQFMDGISMQQFETKEAYRNHVLETITGLAKEGYGALAYATEYGGKNAMKDYMIVFETLCQYDLNYAVKFGVQFGLFGGTINQLGTKQHHDKYLKDIGSATLLGCFAMTETGHGSNVKELETTAIYNHDRKTFTIHSPHFQSGKEYIGNGLHGALAVVFAQLIVNGEHHGVHAILVPYKTASGVIVENAKVEDCGYKMGLNGIDNARIWFDHVEVPKENLLNRYGDIDENGQYFSTIAHADKRFFTMLGALVGGRICVGLGGLIVCKNALSIAIRYAHRRRQFSPEESKDETLLMDYPSHQHRLIPLLAKTIVFHNALIALMNQYVSNGEEDSRKIETKAAGLKAMATWLCTKTVQECREACGGKGYLAENRLSALKADSDIFSTFEGDNTVLMQLVSKGLLTEFKQSFHEDEFRSTMRYIADKIGFTLAEYNIYQSRKTESDHLLSDEFLEDALRYREKKMLVSLADRMRRYIKDNVSPHDAFLNSQVHMIDTAKAYIERLAYREMSKRLLELPSTKEKDVLVKIRRFYALSLLMDHRYFYLESDYMDGSKTKALRQVYSQQMKEIADLSLDIVTSFGIREDLVTIKP